MVILAIIAGSTLNGVMGALFAIPIAGAIQVIAQYIWLATPTADTPHKPSPGPYSELSTIYADDTLLQDEALGA